MKVASWPEAVCRERQLTGNLQRHVERTVIDFAQNRKRAGHPN